MGIYGPYKDVCFCDGIEYDGPLPPEILADMSKNLENEINILLRQPEFRADYEILLRDPNFTVLPKGKGA